MKQWILSLAAVGGVAILSGCGGGEVVVQAQTEAEAAEPRPIDQLEVRALPYDRDLIFDSLKNASSEPEPQIPDSLIELQNRMNQAQQRWRDAEDRWNTARDSLRKLQELTSRLPRQSPQYRIAFRDFGEQESRALTAERQSQAAFREFTALQERFTSQAQEMRVRRDMWGDRAYASVDSVIGLRLEALGREEMTDTTDASGIVRFTLPSGQWWVHARYDLPFEELYWNVPVEVHRGDPIPVTLDRSTAQVRPKF